MNIEERNQLVEENLKLVPFIAHEYFSWYVKPNKEVMEDFISEANIHLIRAVDKFKPELGYAFSTYAVSHIKGKMSRYIKRQIKKQNQNKKCFSLNEPIYETGKKTTFLDNIHCDKPETKIIELKDFIDRKVKINDKEKMIKMLEEGYTQQHIAETFGITTQGLSLRIKKLRQEILNGYLSN